MNVYIVSHGWQYDGENVEGVYSSLGRALTNAKRLLGTDKRRNWQETKGEVAHGFWSPAVILWRSQDEYIYITRWKVNDPTEE